MNWPKLEVEQLYPTISMPVTIALFDLGTPELPDENSAKGGEENGVSVSTVSQDEEYTARGHGRMGSFPVINQTLGKEPPMQEIPQFKSRPPKNPTEPSFLL